MQHLTFYTVVEVHVVVSVPRAGLIVNKSKIYSECGRKQLFSRALIPFCSCLLVTFDVSRQDGNHRYSGRYVSWATLRGNPHNDLWLVRFRFSLSAVLGGSILPCLAI